MTMPYKSERIPISGTKLDLRRKLSDAQKEAIKSLARLEYSQRQLAEVFGCSKRSIQNVLRGTPHNTPTAYPTAYWTQKKREYRQRKQQLYLNGQLQINKPNK